MKISKLLLLILCLSIFLSPQISSAFTLKKNHVSYLAGILLLAIGIKNRIDYAKEINKERESSIFKERFKCALCFTNGIIGALNTLLHSGNFAKKNIPSYLISLASFFYGSYIINVSSLDSNSTGELKAAQYGCICGALVGSGIGIIGSNIILDVMPKLQEKLYK
jgi:hypothetical protein